MITSDAVEQACSEVGTYSEMEMASEFELFFKAQPELCDFIVELTGESDPRVQELSLFLSYILFKTIRGSSETDLPAVTHAAIEHAFRDSEQWIEKLGEAQADAVHTSIVSSFEADTEPYLLQYIITEINRVPEDNVSLSDEQKGEIFFVVKTVMSTLLRRSFEDETTNPI